MICLKKTVCFYPDSFWVLGDNRARWIMGLTAFIVGLIPAPECFSLALAFPKKVAFLFSRAMVSAWCTQMVVSACSEVPQPHLAWPCKGMLLDSSCHVGLAPHSPAEQLLGEN